MTTGFDPNSGSNVFTETKDALLERLKSPIAGTFVVAWLITNWRVPIILVFGSVPDQDRVLLIEKLFEKSFPATLIPTLLIPAAVTFAYLFCMPWLKEVYANWLIQSEYRTVRRRQQLQEDLREEGEYRETLRAICAGLKREIVESDKAFQEISNLAKSGEDPKTGDFYTQINQIAITRKRELENISRHIENFFGHYTGEFPAAYQGFLLKWVRKLSVLLGLPPSDNLNIE